MCWNDFPNLRTEISNTFRTMINSSNFWNINICSISRKMLVLMPWREYLIYDSWENAIICFIHFSGKESKITIVKIPQKKIFVIMY